MPELAVTNKHQPIDYQILVRLTIIFTCQVVFPRRGSLRCYFSWSSGLWLRLLGSYECCKLQHLELLNS